MSSSLVATRLMCQSFIILTIPYVTFGVRSYTAELVAYSHDYSLDFYKYLNINLRNDTQHMVLNGSCVLKRDIKNFDVVIKATVVQKFKSPLKMIDMKINGCDFLLNSPKTLVFSLKNMVKSFGRLMPDKCPLKKGEEYYLKNFYLDVEMLPPRVPDIKMLTTITLEEKRIPFYTGNFTAVLKNVKK